ncbi:MAG: CapA family protein [Ruminococcaceae bacterium]|nr:CapA family protein [Oscillospiraceae bacterium]
MVNYESAFPKTVGDDYGYPFRNVLSYFEQDDYSFANLEGTLGDQGKAQNKKYVFRGIGEYTRILTENSVNAVTLANNHSFDYGQEGFDETKRLLDEAGVPFAEHQSSTTVTTDRGLTIGMYALDFTRGEPDREQMEADIRALKESGVDLVVCAFHWGRENTFQATKSQQEMGRAAIDAGANIVWGHHPHVLQPMEEYNGGIIFYSLGNFAFGGNSAPKDLDTALVQQEVIRELDGSVHLGQLTIVPCSVSSERGINNFQPTPYEAGTKEYDRVLQKLGGTYRGGNLPIG